MKIDKKKKYTLIDILKDGLLLQKTGKPYRSINIVRTILRMAGAKTEFNPIRNQHTYMIPGEMLIKMNEETKKLL